jgi:adenylate kinase family enzyme
MQRISVVGCSGSGKSTFAARLSRELAIPYFELDAMHWGPDWTAASADQLAAQVREVTAADAWVVDGNYHGKIGPLVWERADTVVWLDPPRWRSMSRCVRRTARRVLTGQELWNGNRESWRSFQVWRREDSILWWSWSSHPTVRARYERAMADPAHAGLTFHRLRTAAEVDHFFERLDG